jgi:hypothetical protein
VSGNLKFCATGQVEEQAAPRIQRQYGMAPSDGLTIRASEQTADETARLASLVFFNKILV